MCKLSFDSDKPSKNYWLLGLVGVVGYVGAYTHSTVESREAVTILEIKAFADVNCEWVQVTDELNEIQNRDTFQKFLVSSCLEPNNRLQCADCCIR